MKKKILVVETFIDGVKNDVLSCSNCGGEILMSILSLAPVGADINIKIDEIPMVQNPNFNSRVVKK